MFSTQVGNLDFYSYLIMNDHILSSKQLGQIRLTWFSLHIFQHLDPQYPSNRADRPLLAAPAMWIPTSSPRPFPPGRLGSFFPPEETSLVFSCLHFLYFLSHFSAATDASTLTPGQTPLRVLNFISHFPALGPSLPHPTPWPCPLPQPWYVSLFPFHWFLLFCFLTKDISPHH